MAILDKHAILEKNVTLLAIFAFLVVTIGGIVQIAPLFWLENTIEDVEGMRPYSPLELAGRDIYVREGCYVCHSQMIRPMAIIHWRRSRNMTIRSSGDRNAPGRIWPASAVAIRMTGMWTTCAIRSRSCPSR